MSDIDIDKLINDIKESGKSNNTPMLIMQGIILSIIVLKPILMYWIQAKYKAEPPHESIRKFEARDPEDNTINNLTDETVMDITGDNSDITVK